MKNIFVPGLTEAILFCSTLFSAPLTKRVAAVLFPFLLWSLLSSYHIQSGNRLTYDSLVYIDCARSIQNGNPFQTRVGNGLDAPNWEQMRVFPPGYPILIAGVMAAGIDPYHAALTVSVICSGMFVILVLVYYGKRLSFWSALLLGTLFVSMKPLIHAGSMCWSENAYMLLTAVSLLCFIQGYRGVIVDKRWIFFAGLFGGLSWCMRNAGVALFACSIFFLFSNFCISRNKGSAYVIGAWLAGWMFATVWLCLWNFTAFGKFFPYSMPPSELSLLWNLGVTAWVLGRDLFALGSFSRLAVIKCVLLFSFFVFLIFPRRRAWLYTIHFIKNNLDLLFLLLFMGFYILTIVIARTVYRWGEPINSRHFVPVYWIILLLAASEGEWIWDRLFAHKIKVITLLHLALGLLIVLQIRMSLVRTENIDRTALYQNRSLAVSLGRAIPQDQFVLTDNVAELRVFGNANARYPSCSTKECEKHLIWADIKQAGEDGRLWGIVIENESRFAQGEFGDDLKNIILHPDRYAQLRESLEGGTRILHFVDADLK